jgi:hypothetical protein
MKRRIRGGMGKKKEGSPPKGGISQKAKLFTFLGNPPFRGIILSFSSSLLFSHPPKRIPASLGFTRIYHPLVNPLKGIKRGSVYQDFLSKNMLWTVSFT